MDYQTPPGNLPQRLLVRKPYLALRPGDVLTWSPERRAFLTRAGTAPVPLAFLAQHMGAAWTSVPYGQQELAIR